MKEQWSLRGKRALVIGATRGIGRATAEALLDFGAEVLVVGLDAERAAETGRAWRREGRPGDALAADVATAEGRASVVAAVGSRWPTLDVLVNNVGAGNRKAFVEVTDEDVDALVSLNFASVTMLTRDLHPLLRCGGGASVVNVAAVAGLISVPNTTVYAALKGAVLQLTRSLAVEWAPDRIRVNAVSPWFTRTPRIEAILSQPEVVNRVVARTPLGRVAEAEEVASVIVFLCLEASSYVTGQNVIVDGGATLAGIL